MTFSKNWRHQFNSKGTQTPTGLALRQIDDRPLAMFSPSTMEQYHGVVKSNPLSLFRAYMPNKGARRFGRIHQRSNVALLQQSQQYPSCSKPRLPCSDKAH